MEKNEKEPKFVKIGEKWIDISNKLRKECYKFLKELCIGQDDKRYEIHTYNDEGIRMDDLYLTVSYNGGAHPEYASDVFAEVDAIYIDKNGDIMLDLQEYGEYPITYLSIIEFYSICHEIYMEITM